ncbi:MAG TPA: hypothetical protein PKM43_15490 [Verrucomicrobiota bacterium]|nr:hypothetical protein [Verrucomicrobiota bacterium]HRZ35682.1 hypothetical protein [Candidatus Paceibacterota bacterium]HRZ57874.1 hypothetical protein [Candidatus Paceibacterota bacterium]
MSKWAECSASPNPGGRAFPTAAAPQSLSTLDADANGNLEIVVGFHATSNLVSLPDGTDDLHSYAMALDANGRRLWCADLAGYSTTVHPLVASRPGKPPLLYAWVDGSNLEKRGTAFYYDPTVLVFDLELRERAAHTVGGQSKDPAWRLCVADLDRDGRQEILWLDTSLRVLRLRGWW